MSFSSSGLLSLPRSTVPSSLLSRGSPPATSSLGGSPPADRLSTMSQSVTHSMANSSTWTPSAIATSSGTDGEETPISRTMRYKKITKPLLERKRRARINACLDELKDIMTVALQAEGENVSKLEKADILELTVRHLQKMSHARRLLLTRNPLEDIQRFQAGYTSCAQEAATFLLSVPGVDMRVSQRLLTHLSGNLTSTGLGLPRTAVPASTVVSAGLQRLAARDTASSSSSSPPDCGESPPSPPARPTSEPSPTTARLTVSVRPQSPGEKTMPIKPAAIRLNAQPTAESVWRPYS